MISDFEVIHIVHVYCCDAILLYALLRKRDCYCFIYLVDSYIANCICNCHRKSSLSVRISGIFQGIYRQCPRILSGGAFLQLDSCTYWVSIHPFLTLNGWYIRVFLKVECRKKYQLESVYFLLKGGGGSEKNYIDD